MGVHPEQIAAVILAGGFGRRIQHLLGDFPKPMAPVNGRPFLEWVIRYLSAQNIHHIILSTGYMAETIERHFQSHPVESARLTCVRESEPLGTGGGFLNAVSHAQEVPRAWLVLNGDSLAPEPLNNFFQLLDQSGVEGAILGVNVPDAARFGTITQNPRAELIGFDEKKPGAGVINAGVYLFRAEALNAFPKKVPLSFESDVFPDLIARGRRLKVHVTNAPFLDIGTPETLPLAEEFIRQNSVYFNL